MRTVAQIHYSTDSTHDPHYVLAQRIVKSAAAGCIVHHSGQLRKHNGAARVDSGSGTQLFRNKCQ